MGKELPGQGLGFDSSGASGAGSTLGGLEFTSLMVSLGLRGLGV